MTQATTADGSSDSSHARRAEDAALASAASGSRSPAQIERDIEVTRARLAGTIDEIGDRVSPATMANRAKESVRAQVVEPDGTLRTKRVLAVGGTVASVVALKVIAALRKR